MTRMPGKYGRRSPKNAAALELGPLLTGKVPVHPKAADYLKNLGGRWQMLGNDQAGDCVAVTWANVRRLVTATIGTAEHYPTQDQVWQIYRTQNPDFDPNGTKDTDGPGSQADGGMDIQTLLEYLVKTGGPDGVKAIGFAKVNVKNTAEVKAAIAIFGYVWTGINVLACNMQQFQDGEPWNYDAHSEDDGGHSVITGGYGAENSSATDTEIYEHPLEKVAKNYGPLGGDEKFITWAEETSFTDSFWKHDTEEGWVVIWPEHLGQREFLEGVDQEALASAYQEITGRPFPAHGNASADAGPVTALGQPADQSTDL